MIVWKNGDFAPADETGVSVRDRGVLLGDGLFETIRLKEGAPLRWPAHLNRLQKGGDILGIDLPAPARKADEILVELARRNGLSEGSARVTLTRGPAPRGVLPPAELTPTLLITVAPLPEKPVPPAHLIIARTTRRNEHSPLSGIKNLNYGDGILARREAAAAGADDALLLNTAGRVAETTAGNIFFRLGERIVTPPVEDGALPGIMRGELIRALDVEVCPFSDISEVMAAVISNALGVRRVASIEGREMAPDDPLYQSAKRAVDI